MKVTSNNLTLQFDSSVVTDVNVVPSRVEVKIDLTVRVGCSSILTALLRMKLLHIVFLKGTSDEPINERRAIVPDRFEAIGMLSTKSTNDRETIPRFIPTQQLTKPI